MKQNHGFDGMPPIHSDKRVDITGSELVDLPESPTLGSDADLNTLKTGTTTVGVTAADGVVLATDMRASMGNMVSSKSTQKVEQIHPAAAMTIAGSVSAAQNLISTIQAESKLYEVRHSSDMSINALASMLANLLRSGAFFVVVPVLGGVDEDGAHVYSLDALGGGSEEDYAVSGSGSQFALGVLENRYEDGLSMEEAESVATDAVLTAIERDTASGNGLNVARITADGVDIESHDSLEAVQ